MINQKHFFISELDISTTCSDNFNNSLTVNQVSGGQDPYLFSFNGDSFENISEWDHLSSGTYELLVQDSTGCIIDTTIIIPFTHPGFFELSANPVSVSCGDNSSLSSLILNFEFDSIAWDTPDLVDCISTDCQNPTVTLLETTTFTATIFDVNGCELKDTITIFVEDDQNEVFIPNAFSPNGDGVNDFFLIFSGPKIKEVQVLEIFDRWETLFLKIIISHLTTPHMAGMDVLKIKP